jgi:hypothetical protein
MHKDGLVKPNVKVNPNAGKCDTELIIILLILFQSGVPEFTPGC